jgi:hypothetical protein
MTATAKDLLAVTLSEQTPLATKAARAVPFVTQGTKVLRGYLGNRVWATSRCLFFACEQGACMKAKLMDGIEVPRAGEGHACQLHGASRLHAT